jgi:hypothetical protein
MLPFVGVYVVAKDGQVAWAMSYGCTRDHTFFDALCDADKLDLAESYQAYLRDLARHSRGPRTLEAAAGGDRAR